LGPGELVWQVTDDDVGTKIEVVAVDVVLIVVEEVTVLVVVSVVGDVNVVTEVSVVVVGVVTVLV